ncbi:MAG: IclR family transcriptional regulator [Pseudomonadota bacterium]
MNADIRPLSDPAAPEKPGSAIAKAMGLLKEIAAASEPLSLAELSARSGMPKASAHRMLMQLEETGAAKRDMSGKRFMLGDDFVALAARAIGHSARMGGVRDAMAALARNTGETCNLGILDGHRMRYVERVECDRPVRVHLRVGSLVPVYATAVGKMMLAFMPPQRLGPFLDAVEFEQLTPTTLTRQQLEKALPDIRAQRVSINRSESMDGVVGVGVPVTSPEGEIIAGLAVEIIASRFNDAVLGELKTALDRTAQKIAAIYFGSDAH